LFEKAAQQFKALTEQHEKFNLTLLTLDTHHPRGDASKSCPAYGYSNNSMLQAVHCTDYLLGKFLKVLQQSESYKDTLIFVMSDHLAMENVAMPFYPKGKRKLVAFALNTGIAGKIDMAGAHFDMAPTILDLLHIKTNAQFPLGQSLIKPEKSDRFAIYQNNGYEWLKGFLRAADKQMVPIHIYSGHGIEAQNMPAYTMKIGGHPIVMSLEGWPMYPEDHIFIVRCALDGQVQRYRITSEKDAAKIIETYPNAFYFMLTKTAQIPFGLCPGNTNGNWKWYLGNPSSVAGVTGEAPQFGNVNLDETLCRKILDNNQRSSAQVFSIRRQVQRLHQRLQVAQRQSATAYAHFCPAKIEAVSSSVANGDSYIALDDLPLKATKGITLAVIDPLTNSLTHYRSYNIVDFPKATNALLSALNKLKNNKVVLVVIQGDVPLPMPVISAFEKLGARQIQKYGAGQPYILMAKVGKKTVFEIIGKPGTTISKSLSVYDNEGSLSSIKQLWNDSAIVIQSASYGEGSSYGIIENDRIPRVGRGLNVLILDASTKAVKLSDQFDTYADADAIGRLSNTLLKAKSNEIVLVFAADSATGGALGIGLPEDLKAGFKRLGAVCVDEIRFRTPYIFLTKIGSDFRIEKCSQTEGVLQVELTPQEADKLFSNTAHVPVTEPLHLSELLPMQRDWNRTVLQQEAR
jgi:hypothetical protein